MLPVLQFHPHPDAHVCRLLRALLLLSLRRVPRGEGDQVPERKFHSPSCLSDAREGERDLRSQLSYSSCRDALSFIVNAGTLNPWMHTAYNPS